MSGATVGIFRVPTTPQLCYDVVECIAEDTILPASGSASFIVSSVTGTSTSIEYYVFHCPFGSSPKPPM